MDQFTLHRALLAGRPLSARPLNEAPQYGASTARPTYHHQYADPAPSRRATEGVEHDNNSASVASMQFAGLVMQLELERSKREDADRLLRDSTNIQLDELRETLKHIQLENATQREILTELRRSRWGDGGHGATGASQNAGSSSAAYGRPSGGQTAASISREMELSKLVERVDDLENVQQRHQRVLEDRNARLESAVSEFCHAHISVEVERLRTVAREAARYSVDEMIKQRTEELSASWTSSLHEVQQHVMLVAQRSRDAVGAIRERIESVDAAVRSSQSQIDLQRDALNGVTDNRALTAAMATVRSDVDRLGGALRDRSADWNAAEAQLRVEVAALKEALGEQKTTFGTALARRIDGLAASSATKAELLTAVDRATAVLEPRVAESAEALNSLKQIVEALRGALDTRIRAVEERLTRTQENVSRTTDVAKAAFDAQQQMGELIHNLVKTVDDLSGRVDNANSAQHNAVLGVTSRLQSELSTLLASRISEVTASLDVRLDAVDSSARTRLDQLEKSIQLTRRELNESSRQLNETIAIKAQESQDANTRNMTKLDQRIAEAVTRRTLDTHRSEIDAEMAAVREHCDNIVAEAQRAMDGRLRAATTALETSLRTAMTATTTTTSSDDGELVSARAIASANAAVSRRVEDVEGRVDRLAGEVDERVAEVKRQIQRELESYQAELRKVRKAAEDAQAASQDVAAEAARSMESVNAAHSALSRANDAANAKLNAYIDTKVEAFRADLLARCVSQDALDGYFSTWTSQMAARNDAAQSATLRQYREIDDRFAMFEQRLRALQQDFDETLERRDSRRDADVQRRIDEVKASVAQQREALEEIMVAAPATRGTPAGEESSGVTLLTMTRHIERACAEIRANLDRHVTDRFNDSAADVASVISDLRREVNQRVDEALKATRGSAGPTSTVEGSQLDELNRRMAELAHDVAVISRDAAGAAAEAASRAFERYRDEVLALTASVSSQAASPNGGNSGAGGPGGELYVSPRSGDGGRTSASIQRSESVAEGSSVGSNTNQVSMISRADFDTVREALHDLQNWRSDLEAEFEEFRSLLRIADGRGADHADAIRTVDSRLSAIEDQVIETIEDVASSISNYVAVNEAVLTDGEDPIDDIVALLDSKITPLTLRSIVLAMWRVVGSVGVKTASITETTDEAVSRLTGVIHLHEDQLSILSAQLGLRMPWDDEVTDEGSMHSSAGVAGAE